MKKVTKIAPTLEALPVQTKLRVAAYCRVSTDTDEQLESLEAQVKHYTTLIRSNPEWELSRLYIDQGITGTKKEKRSELLRMISDCEEKQLDLIITKSISRFARNTADCLELVRKLNSLGIFILFEKENIHTGSMESELMLSILSGMAENESFSIAQNNKWSIQRRFKNGTYKISCAPYGYTAVDGKLIINDTQSEIIKFIYAEILSGKSTHKVAKELNQLNVPTQRGGRWSSSTIRSMVSNEKYTGDAIFQKTYTDDHFKRHVNDGVHEQYLIQNHHEALVSREDFIAVQTLITQRGKEKGIEKYSTKYLQRYPFTGKIICSVCGDTFKRRIHSSGMKYVAWTCSTHISDIDKCMMKYIREADLELAFITMMNKLIFGNQAILKPLLLTLRSISPEDSTQKLQLLDEKLQENTEQQKVLVSLMTKGYLDPPVYKKSNNDLLQEVKRLHHQKETLLRFINSDNKHLQDVSELLQFTTKAKMLTTFDGIIFERFVNKIIIYSRSEIGFEMKCGITLKERLDGRNKKLQRR